MFHQRHIYTCVHMSLVSCRSFQIITNYPFEFISKFYVRIQSSKAVFFLCDEPYIVYMVVLSVYHKSRSQYSQHDVLSRQKIEYVVCLFTFPRKRENTNWVHHDVNCRVFCQKIIVQPNTTKLQYVFKFTSVSLIKEIV